MDETFMNPIIDAGELADTHRYGEEEHPVIMDFILGAQALLHNAGAFKPDNPMTKVAINMMVGFWLENRDGMNYEYKNIETLPYSLQAIIYSLQYLPDVKVDVDINE